MLPYEKFILYKKEKEKKGKKDNNKIEEINIEKCINIDLKNLNKLLNGNEVLKGLGGCGGKENDNIEKENENE